jgi:hypothetical protein
MEKEFVTYNQALALKELGFDEPCFAKYTSNRLLLSINWSNVWCENINESEIYAPLYQQVFRWFREKYDWTIKVNQVTNSNWSYTLSNFPNDGKYYGELYKTYEEAESACID